MSRNNRIVYPGAIYHITQRGNNKDYIFQIEKHKGFLIKQIKEYNIRFDFQLLAYTLMDNHYHLLIKTNDDPISEIMFFINNTISKYLARELNRTGHIFQDRFHCELVDNQAYLIWVLRYIHRNPIRAHICEDIDDYKWSSHYYYKKGIDTFVHPNIILNMISKDKALAIKTYLSLIGRADNTQGSSADFKEIKELYNLNATSSFYNDQSISIPERRTLSDILSSLEISLQYINLIKSGSNKRILTPYKLQFVKEALTNKYTITEIAAFLSKTQSAMSKLLARHDG